VHSDKIIGFVQNYLIFHNMTITKRGVLTISSNLWENLVDKTYSQACNLAVVKKPSHYHLTEKMKTSFFSHFGQNWDDCVANNTVMNAVETCSYLVVSHKELLSIWVARSQQQSSYADINRWFKCCYIDDIPGKKPIFCVNGFYLGLRGHFSNSAIAVPYFVVEWKVGHWSWDHFLQNLIGDDDPARAKVSSLRGTLYRDWQNIGLGQCPNVIENCLHASESAFEALIEKKNWLPNWNMQGDYFFRQLLKTGIDEEEIEILSRNITLEGEGSPLYDHLIYEDAATSIPILKELVKKRVKGLPHGDMVYDI
jgi:hypothetical protein